jgi:transcriptional regulator with XRE-family HTH domain
MTSDDTVQESIEASRTFGERLKALRTKEGLTQPELAALLNVKRQTVASWEQGSTTPDLRTLFLLRANLRQQFGSDVDLVELVGERRPGDGSAPVDIVVRLLQRISAMGVEDVHLTRAEALAAFCPFLEREQKSICVVSSSFLGVTRVAPARVGEILQKKAGALKKDFKILLTHPSLSDSREQQEGRTRGSIQKEIEESVHTLLAWGVDEDSIRFYNGTPTIFLMFTPTRMLANPYTYEAEAFKTVTFELAAAKTKGAQGGIYEQYFEHHFSRPWNGKSQRLRDVRQFFQKDAEPQVSLSAAKKR